MISEITFTHSTRNQPFSHRAGIPVVLTQPDGIKFHGAISKRFARKIKLNRYAAPRIAILSSHYVIVRECQ